MLLLLYVIFNMTAIYLFTKIKKELHILEIIVSWFIASYLFQNFSALCYMNFKTLFIPDRLSYEFSHFLNRTVLYPIIMVTFLHFFLIKRGFAKKVLLLVLFISILTGVEWLEHFSGVLIHVNWSLWWSIVFWLIALLILIGFLKLFRKILYKGE